MTLAISAMTPAILKLLALTQLPLASSETVNIDRTGGGWLCAKWEKLAQNKKAGAKIHIA